MLAPLLQEYRKYRMARFAFWVVAYGMALWLVDRFSRGVPAPLWFLFWLTFIPAAFYYVFRLVKLVKRHVLWHLRRRLILTYFFIAVVPIALILVLVVIAAWILNGQFASFLIVSNFRSRVDDLQQLNRVVIHQVDHVDQESPEALLSQLQQFVTSDLATQRANYPGLEVTFRCGPLMRAFRLDGSPPVQPATLPSWLKRDEFGGIALHGNQLSLRAIERERTAAGELTVILSQPFTPELLDLVGAGIGPIAVFTTHKGMSQATQPGSKAPSGINFSGPAPLHESLSTPEGVQEISVHSKSLVVPPPANSLDYTVQNVAALDPIRWDLPEEKPDTGTGLFLVTSRVVALNRQLLANLGQFSQLYWVAFAVVGIVFLVIELAALVVGVQLTRSITTTVDKLNLATERVRAGDFSHRINLPARDQLTALGGAFDGMTASVEGLLRESLEKTRLEGELEIAREVQNRLFPQTVPEVSGLRLYGVCKPARVVSGDYYDFLNLSEGRIGLVLGDISGKGISAALLMASIQSALHAQFYTNGNSSAGAAHAGPISTGEVVSRLNRQLFASTPREKYVTFFYAVYDPRTRRMSYTNAGHLPPILFRPGRIERLEAGGTVVGLFPVARYEQAEIQLEPGDMLLAYTDGMTEPENSYGEEFGEERLLQVAERARHSPPEAMVEEIYRSVSDWTGSPELQDDMTLVIAKAMA